MGGKSDTEELTRTTNSSRSSKLDSLSSTAAKVGVKQRVVSQLRDIVNGNSSVTKYLAAAGGLGVGFSLLFGAGSGALLAAVLGTGAVSMLSDDETEYVSPTVAGAAVAFGASVLSIGWTAVFILPILLNLPVVLGLTILGGALGAAGSHIGGEVADGLDR